MWGENSSTAQLRVSPASVDEAASSAVMEELGSCSQTAGGRSAAD